MILVQLQQSRYAGLHDTSVDTLICDSSHVMMHEPCQLSLCWCITM